MLSLYKAGFASMVCCLADACNAIRVGGIKLTLLRFAVVIALFLLCMFHLSRLESSLAQLGGVLV